MMGRGSYLGGSTVIGPGSDWFSRPKKRVKTKASIEAKKARWANRALRKVEEKRRLAQETPEEREARLAKVRALEEKSRAKAEKKRAEKEARIRLAAEEKLAREKRKEDLCAAKAERERAKREERKKLFEAGMLPKPKNRMDGVVVQRKLRMISKPTS